MSKTIKLLWVIISVACLALSTNVYAAKGSGGGGGGGGGGVKPPPVDTLPANLQAEIALSEDIIGSLSLSGNTIAAKCRYTSATGVLTNAMCMLEKTTTGWVLQGKVLPLPVAQQFIDAPALNGNTLLIPVANVVTSNYEYYVFVRNAAGLWVQQAKITPAVGEAFGWWGALSGDTLAINATSPTELPNGGAVIYQRTATATGVVWTRQADIKLPVGSTSAASVALSGDTVVVTNDSIIGGGAAYVYKRTGTLWAQQAKLVPSDASPLSDGFGYSAAINGDNIIIGAPYASPNTITIGVGAAYTFHRSNGIWKQEAKLLRSPIMADKSDLYGIDVAANGDAVMVRASGFTERAGSVYVYQRSLTGTWPLVSKVDPEGTFISLDLRGAERSIGLDGNTYVSAGRHNLLGQPLKRRIFVFNR